MEDEAKLREFNEEMEKNKFVLNTNGNTPIINESFENAPDAQNLINNFQSTPPAEIATSFSRCEQCGTIHPPIKRGERCPVAPIKDKTGKEIDLNPFFAQLKNIFLSQIQQKDIKNHTKLIQFIVIEITKLLENYNE